MPAVPQTILVKKQRGWVWVCFQCMKSSPKIYDEWMSDLVDEAVYRHNKRYHM